MREDEFRPDKFEIPAPRRTTYPRGKYSSATQSPARSFRISDDDYYTMQEAAALCDMSIAEFVRWCTFHGALEIKKQHQLHGFK